MRSICASPYHLITPALTEALTPVTFPFFPEVFGHGADSNLVKLDKTARKFRLKIGKINRLGYNMISHSLIFVVKNNYKL